MVNIGAKYYKEAFGLYLLLDSKYQLFKRSKINHHKTTRPQKYSNRFFTTREIEKGFCTPEYVTDVSGHTVLLSAGIFTLRHEVYLMKAGQTKTLTTREERIPNSPDIPSA